MKSESNPPYRLLKNVLIPMPDGIRLAGDVWLPASDGRYPVILTYLPYNKDGMAGSRIMEDLPYFFARNGYAYAIVDIRGTGCSEGVTTEIYSLQEQSDGYEVVEWLAGQPWCNGSVGMLGWSYGFTSTVLVAAKDPPHLKAIVPFYGNVNLYDAFWEGGSLLAFHFLGYLGSLMVVMNGMPPGYRDPEGRWIRMWQNRIDGNIPWLLAWVEHQTYDEYWSTKSIAPNYGRIKAATLTIAGWNDVYPTWPTHLYQEISAPKKIIMGPWLHQEPHKSRVGPRLDYYPILLRWFDRYLKGMENGVEDDPAVMLYTAQYTPPATLSMSGAQMNGSWRYERKLPIERTKETTLYVDCATRGLLEVPRVDDESASYSYDPTVGTAAGLIGGVFTETGLPIDQRIDEVKSIVFSTEPLEEDLEVTGQPQAVVHLSSTAEVAGLSVKLTDQAPDGTTALVSRYYMNGTRRNSKIEPVPMRTGEIYELKIPMNFVSYRFLKGHRLKLMVSSADFPHVWPTPERSTNRLWSGKSHPSRLILPVVPHDASIKTFQLPPVEPTATGTSKGLPNSQEDQWRISQDMGRGSVSVEWSRESEMFPSDVLRVQMGWWLKASTTRDRPADSRVDAKHHMRFSQSGSVVEGRSDVIVQTDDKSVHVQVGLEIDYDGAPYARKSWSQTFPRRLW